MFKVETDLALLPEETELLKDITQRVLRAHEERITRFIPWHEDELRLKIMSRPMTGAQKKAIFEIWHEATKNLRAAIARRLSARLDSIKITYEL